MWLLMWWRLHHGGGGGACDGVPKQHWTLHAPLSGCVGGRRKTSPSLTDVIHESFLGETENGPVRTVDTWDIR